jgi:hypothetical protein
MLFVYGGNNDYLKICSTSGSSVQNITGGGQSYWYDAAMSDDTKYILAAKGPDAFDQPESIYLSSDSGTTFNAISSINSYYLRNPQCSVSDNGQYMMVATGNRYTSGSPNTDTGKLFVSTDYGVTFNLVLSGYNFTSSDISSNGRTMIATSNLTNSDRDARYWLNQNFGSGSFSENVLSKFGRWVVIGR